MELIQRVREFWDERPCNIRHSPKAIGTREYFDEVETRKYFVEPHIPGFAQFERWRGKKVLEIGCGIGTDAVNFASHGAQVTAIDISAKSLEICRQRFEVYGLEGRFYSTNGEALSATVPVESYDLVYSFGSIHHTPNPVRVFQEILKYCGSHTEVRIMLYSRWSWKALWIVIKYGRCAFLRARELVREYSEAQEGSPITYVYTFNDVRRLMRDFHILEMKKEHIFPYAIEKYVRYQYQRVWYFRWIPRPLFRWLECHVGWHTLVVAKPKV